MLLLAASCRFLSLLVVAVVVGGVAAVVLGNYL